MNRDELLTQMVMEIGPDDWWDGELRRLYEGCIFGWNEYQLRRAEIINKPDWSEAPEWAEWLSQEEDGNWCWHQLKPEMDPTGWTMFAPKDEEHALALRGKRPNGHDWRQTLERRPTTTSLGATAFETDGGGDSYMFMTLEGQEIPAEERHDCDRCGGSWWSPHNTECPCQASRSDGSTTSYYEFPEGATELQDLISYRNLNAQDGEIFRAVYRKGRASHSDELRDAKKVLFYAKAEVERLERYGK